MSANPQYIPNADDIRKIIDFSEKNATCNPDKLRFKYHNDDNPWLSLAINNIESHQKGRSKLPTLMPIFVPATVMVEQATAEPIARFHAELAHRLSSNCKRFVDLTTGIGIDFRAIIDNFDPKVEAIAIERDPLYAYALRYNLSSIGFNNTSVINADCVEWLNRYVGEPFDLAFIDPARRGNNGERLYNVHQCSPDVTSMFDVFHAKAPVVMVKLSPMLDVVQTLRDLPDATEIHIVDDGMECRELLEVLDFKNTSRVRGLNAKIYVDSIGKEPLTFTLSDCASSADFHSAPKVGEWLFEPSAATMKAAPWSILINQYALKKLHPNTHLFVADAPIPSLPGRWYEITDIVDYASKNIKRFASVYPKADIAVRNFPISASELQKKLKVKPGGDIRVIGVTLNGSARTISQGSQALLVLEK